MSLIGLDKLALLKKAIKANGGVFRLLEKLWRMDTVKEGTLMGWDSNCNKYYENQRYMISRSRWVEFSPHFKWEYDASQVTPEWFGWLHYKTDQLPCQDCAKYCLNCCSCSHRWLLPPEENLTGTCCAYYPYSTTMSHIGLWDGKDRDLPSAFVVERKRHLNYIQYLIIMLLKNKMIR
ncbi:probable NADH dehydrogenase [ubiquinone] 1 alpha subcomplex subunit 12 isoform X1 [Choristoneura fumiferana]|uniref:probable NADH dehydrogenase [ubiquinone] 1 alpha subcomplex subunit 12 isoform X1 n=1 Tax=Choristoneura fumiferana TaxID=7141 RepID=UPI003D159CEF